MDTPATITGEHVSQEEQAIRYELTTLAFHLPNAQSAQSRHRCLAGRTEGPGLARRPLGGRARRPWASAWAARVSTASKNSRPGANVRPVAREPTRGPRTQQPRLRAPTHRNPTHSPRTRRVTRGSCTSKGGRAKAQNRRIPSTGARGCSRIRISRLLGRATAHPRALPTPSSPRRQAAGGRTRAIFGWTSGLPTAECTRDAPALMGAVRDVVVTHLTDLPRHRVPRSRAGAVALKLGRWEPDTGLMEPS